MLYLLADDPSTEGIESKMTQDIPKVRDAGSCWLMYMAVDSENGYVSDIEKTVINVIPSEIVLIWDDVRQFPYDAQPHVPGVSLSGVYGSDECSVTELSGTEKTIGKHTASVLAISNSNYALPSDSSAEFEITKGYTDPEAIPGLVYSGAQQRLVTPGTAQAGNMQYRLDDGEWQPSVPTAVNAGVYIVHFRTDIPGSPEGSVQVSIAKAPAGSVTGENWVLGGTGTIRFTCTTPYSADAVFRIDGLELSSRYCVLRSGSTVAEVSYEFLNTLSVGQHSFSFSYDNYETSSGTFKVTTRVVTGDGSDLDAYLVTAASSACFLMLAAAILISSKKKAKQAKQH